MSGATVKYDSKITNLADAKSRTDFSYAGDGYPLSEYLNGESSATISGGKVTIKLGVPKELYSLSDLSDFIPDSVNVSSTKVKGIFTDMGFFTSDDKYLLVYEKDDYNYVFLAYVDGDVTIKGTHKETDPDDGITYTETWDVSLKKGWNFLIASENKATHTGTLTSSASLPSGFTWTVFEHSK